MTRFNRISIVSIVFTGILLTGIGAIAVTATQQQQRAATISRAYLHSYSLPSSGLALEGYCPVSYFTDHKATRGKPEYASTYFGVDYYLASADAKRAFERNPQIYIPAYGGWCAFGMAIQDKFPVDPTNFKIVNGRLMLFLRNQNVDALAKWNQGDEQEQVLKADAHWKKVSG